MIMLDNQKINDLLSGKIGPESLLSDTNLSVEEKAIINLIAQGKKLGMTMGELKEWIFNVVKSPVLDKSDNEIIHILEKLSDATQ